MPPTTPPSDSPRIEAAGVEVTVDDDEVELADPAQRGLREPRPARRVGLDAVLAGLGAEAQYAQRRADRQPAAQHAVPGPGPTRRPGMPRRTDASRVLPAVSSTSARSTSSAAATTASPPTTSCVERFGLAPVTSFTEVTGEATEALPDDPEIDASDPIDDPDILDVVQLRRRRRQPARAGQRGGRRRGGHRAFAARRWPPGWRRSTATSTPSTRSSAWSPSRTWPAASWASCSSRSGRASSRRCATATASSTCTTRRWPRSSSATASRYRHTLAEIIELNTDADVADNVFRAPT